MRANQAWKSVLCVEVAFSHCLPAGSTRRIRCVRMVALLARPTGPVSRNRQGTVESQHRTLLLRPSLFPRAKGPDVNEALRQLSLCEEFGQTALATCRCGYLFRMFLNVEVRGKQVAVNFKHLGFGLMPRSTRGPPAVHLEA